MVMKINTVEGLYEEMRAERDLALCELAELQHINANVVGELISSRKEREALLEACKAALAEHIEAGGRVYSSAVTDLLESAIAKATLGFDPVIEAAEQFMKKNKRLMENLAKAEEQDKREKKCALKET